MSQGRGAGFSLIELLIVAVIIVVLAALLLPAIRMVKDAANTAVCASNLRQLGAIGLIYAADNDNRLAPSYCANQSNGAAAAPGWDTTYYASGLLDNMRLLACPNDPDPRPELIRQKKKSYSMAYQNFRPDPLVAYWTNSPHYAGGNPLAKVMAPGEKVWMAEFQSVRTDLYGCSYYGVLTAMVTDASVPWWHRGNGANYLYVDGHVKELVEYDSSLVNKPAYTAIWQIDSTTAAAPDRY